MRGGEEKEGGGEETAKLEDRSPSVDEEPAKSRRLQQEERWEAGTYTARPCTELRCARSSITGETAQSAIVTQHSWQTRARAYMITWRCNQNLVVCVLSRRLTELALNG